MAEAPQYKVIVSDRARQMLGEHIRFLAQKSPAAARKTKAALLSAVRSLNRMPERYSFLFGEFIPPNKYHKMYVAEWYLVLYQIKDSQVFVDYILDCRQDYQWLL